MIGVVLWSDPADRKAVIWCEDHGDLAFYHQPEDEPKDRALDPGDLVHFDVSVDQKLRLVHNPKLVAEAAFRALPDQMDLLDGIVTGRRETAEIRPIPVRYSDTSGSLEHQPVKRRAT